MPKVIKFWGLLVTIIFPGFVLLASSVVCADQVQKNTCQSLNNVKKHLSEKWLEKSVGKGLAVDGFMYEITARKDGSSWTLLRVSPDKIACAVTAGAFWAMPDLQSHKHKIGGF